jgi:hypothetical protein
MCRPNSISGATGSGTGEQDAMDSREHEKTYERFTTLAKWSTIVAIVVTFIVVAGFIA